MPIRKSSLSGIPFGTNSERPSSPSVGQSFFNGDLQRLELYTGSTYGWQNIVSVIPTVISFTGSVIETNSTNTITITGTGFSAGAIASLIGADNTEYVANSTTVNSLTSITAVFGSIPANNEPYSIKINNPTNFYGILYNTLNVNDKPIWQTASGSLGTFDEGSAVSVSVSATDEENNTITYAVSSGSLPGGLSLNSSTGVISGTASGISGTTTYSFTITASDGINTPVARSFSIVINSVVVWNTASGSLGTITDVERSTKTFTLSATALANTVTYSVTSGALPAGMTLNSSTGVISGANSVASVTTSTFTVTASDGTASQSRSFSITVNPGTSSTFDASGTNIQSWTAPATASAAVFHIYGAGGGGASGGTGGYTTGTYTVVPGRAYNVYVGLTASGRSGGWPGGGQGALWNSTSGNGGGGYSAVQDSTNSVYLAIAGAGGGSSAGNGSAGATGGGTTGGNANSSFGSNTGGTQTAGGTVGITIDTTSSPGSAFAGGAAYSGTGNSGWSGGGGGGSGYYGGAGGSTGGGAVTGGAGGSGYVNTSYTSNGTTVQGVGSYSGRGTAGNANTNGRVIILT